MNEKLAYSYRDPAPEPDEAEPNEAAVHHQAEDRNVNETEKARNGWTDGQDPDVVALRDEMDYTNPELLRKLDDGIDTNQNVWQTKDTEMLASCLRVSLDYVAEQDPDLNRQGAANAAAWAAFQQLHEDLQTESQLDGTRNFGPVEKHYLETRMCQAQTDYASAMSDPRLSNREAVESMKNSYQEAITAASGNAAPDRDPK